MLRMRLTGEEEGRIARHARLAPKRERQRRALSCRVCLRR